MKDSTSRSPSAPSGWMGLVIPVGLLATGFVWVGSELVVPPTLRADGAVELDSDGDGLVDDVELVRWLDPFTPDTDADGWSDLEELARQTDALDVTSFPEPAPEGHDIGMAAYTEFDSLHVLTAIYAENGDLSQLDLKSGISLSGNIIELPPSIVFANAEITIVPAKNPGDLVVLVNSSYGAGLVQAFGSLGIYSTLGKQGQDPTTADALNLIASGGALLEVTTPPLVQTTGAPTGAGGSATGSSTTSASSGNGYRPLGGGEEIPASWEP